MFGLVPFKKNSDSIERRGDNFNNFLDSFFDDDLFVPFAMKPSNFKVDLKENDNNYVVEADTPWH